MLAAKAKHVFQPFGVLQKPGSVGQLCQYPLMRRSASLYTRPAHAKVGRSEMVGFTSAWAGQAEHSTGDVSRRKVKRGRRLTSPGTAPGCNHDLLLWSPLACQFAPASDFRASTQSNKHAVVGEPLLCKPSPRAIGKA